MTTTITFTKMQGTGNDYIYINTFSQPVDLPDVASFVRFVSNRHKGIGSDGVIFISPSDVADAKMDMYNADGSVGLMCGNAIRCVAKYIYDNALCPKSDVLFIETLSGVKHIRLGIENNVVVSATVDMNAPILTPAYIPTTLPSDTPLVDYPLAVGDITYPVTLVSMGNPHCVIFTSSVSDLTLAQIGPPIEQHVAFPDRINTEFVEVISDTHLKMRVWERGSGETMSCGTGACAAVVAAISKNLCQKNTDITVSLLGGDLIIKQTNDTVFMTGPCTTVFEGNLIYEA